VKNDKESNEIEVTLATVAPVSCHLAIAIKAMIIQVTDTNTCKK
jgi:hypothetical protein